MNIRYSLYAKAEIMYIDINTTSANKVCDYACVALVILLRMLPYVPLVWSLPISRAQSHVGNREG